ncbi:MAG: hypothetical protein J2P36_10270 [Ktedonobacteraceae bacterium]|nr:hypothetical protein [Ktedonobacteraceae bacterium]
MSNIYLNKLDKYIEETLIPAYTKGERRRANPPYRILTDEIAKLRRKGKHQEAEEVRKRAQQLPSVDPNDSEYRRLKYVRYADDWLIGFVGPRAEVEAIKRLIATFLRDEMKLELSEEKTLITHARTETARFLGYHISTMQANTYRPHGKRYVNGKVELRIPEDVLKQKCERYLKNGKPIHRKELETETAYSIMTRYQAEYRGLVEYYQMANNLNLFKTLRWVMEASLTKTLAAKFQLTVSKVYDRYQTTHIVSGKSYKGLHVIVEREGKPPLIAKWGNIPLKRKTQVILNDQPKQTWIWTGHTELEKRLLADTCELCGSHENISVHHIRALKDLHQPGRREKPRWMHMMASRRRKTLIVCWSCHMDIQHGRPCKNTKISNSISLESRIPGNS